MFHSLLLLFLIIIISSFTVLLSNSFAEPVKAVIISFDDGILSQYTYAKPILDKYNFKVAFYIICNSVGKEDRMLWDDILILAEEGHDIGSHSMNHKKLKLSDEEMKYEIIESKKCLEKNGIDVTSFSFSYNGGDNDKNIIKIIADNYYIARTGTEPLMLFQCINGKNFISNNEDENDNKCNYSTKNNENKPMNLKRYTITGLSHEAYKKSGG